METSRAFRDKIRTVRIRCGFGLLLRHAGRVLTAVGALFGLAVLVQRLLALPILVPWAWWGLGCLAAALVAVLWLREQPGRMQACLLLDERLKLNERFSTTLALADSDDPFARAARAESLHAVEQANLTGHFPIRLSRSWYCSAGLWLAAVAILLYMPQKDLLGLMHKRQHQQQQAVQLADAAAQVQETTKPIEALVRELRDAALAEDLKKLDALSQSGSPQEMKQQAIKTLGDLSEKIQQMQNSPRIQAGRMLQQMLRQLHGSSDPLTQQIRMSLAKGDYGQAAGALRQLQSQLASGSLSDERRKELASRLQELGKELMQLSQEKHRIEQELEKNGLDEDLANASPEELREALQEQGVSPEVADELVQKAGACQIVGRLGSVLDQIRPDEVLQGDTLNEPIEQLDATELLMTQIETLGASAEQIASAIESLGQGASERPGAVAAQSPSKPERGGGQGEGIGLSSGDHSITSDPLTANKMALAPSQGRENATLAGGYFRGDALVNGGAERPFTEVIQAGRVSAAEAISENQIPRRYEETIKTYFNQLEGSRR